MRTTTARGMGWLLLGSTILAGLGLVGYAALLLADFTRTGRPGWVTVQVFWAIQDVFLVFSAVTGLLLVIVGRTATRIVGAIGLIVPAALMALFAWRSAVDLSAFTTGWGFIPSALLAITSPFVEAVVLVVAVYSVTRLLRKSNLVL